MRYLFIGLSNVFSVLVFSQYQNVKHIPKNQYHYIDIRHIDFVTENDGMFAGNVRPLDIPYNDKVIVYNTHDGGISWDSTFFDNEIIGGIDVVSANVAYIFTKWGIYENLVYSHSENSIYRTIDGGSSWTEIVVDTANLGNQYEPIQFLNDSTGVLALSSGVYLTKNYGDTWTIIDSTYFLRPVAVESELYVFGSKTAYWYDLENFQRNEFLIDPSVNGSITRTSSFENTILTSSYGVHEEPNNNYNYISLIIDELPLGEQKNIRINDQGATDDLELTENNLFLVINAMYRSIDNGESFFKQTTFEPEGFDSTWVDYCTFPSDTVGYIITFNHSLGYKIQKTINAGGVTTDYLPNVVEYTADVEEKGIFNGIKAYPNPSENEVNILSEKTILKITVVDLQGRELFESKYNSKTIMLNISTLSKGQYLFRIETEEGSSILNFQKI